VIVMGSMPTHRVRVLHKRSKSPTASHLVQNLRAAIERQLSGLERPSTAAAPILVAFLTAVARRQLAKPAYKASRES